MKVKNPKPFIFNLSRINQEFFHGKELHFKQLMQKLQDNQNSCQTSTSNKKSSGFFVKGIIVLLQCGKIVYNE